MRFLQNQKETDIRLIRHTQIAERIVFLDGLTGTGKTMMGPLIGSLRGLEIGRLEHIYEYLCALNHLEKIDEDAAVFMVRMYADLAAYNMMISREINFRPTDLSGIFRNPKTLQYLRRLLAKDGNGVLERIRGEKPALHIITHQMLGIAHLIFRAFASRVRIVEMVRHPLYLLEHWYSYIDRHGRDSRDFTIWIDYKGQSLPWFAQGREEKYVNSNSLDKTIYSIEYLTQLANDFLGALSAQERKQIVLIPFEKFVLDPEPFLKDICMLLNTATTSETKRILKQQKCPRRLVADGPALEIYKRYGFKEPARRATEISELEKRRDFAKKHASPETLQTLDNLSKDYERQHGRWY